MTHPQKFEPLIPQHGLREFALRTRTIIETSQRLQGAAHPTTRTRLQEVIRFMNAYYSSQMQGQRIHPTHIAQALQEIFAQAPSVARSQRLAVAHIAAEKELEKEAALQTATLSSTFLARAHANLYERLSQEDRRAHSQNALDPGIFRQTDTTDQQRIVPEWDTIPTLLKRADQVYLKQWGLDTLLIAIASAHHRFSWIQPFLGGNATACQLQTDCALFPVNGGLWSLTQGFARNRDAYYARLNKQEGEHNEVALMQWCDFFISLCEEQVKFMSRMLDVTQLKQRIAGLILVRSQENPDYRSQAILPLHYVLTAGPVSRGDFLQMLGLGERTGRKVLSQLIKSGLLVSSTPKGEVSIGFPLDALSTLFPNLYPEAAHE